MNQQTTPDHGRDLQRGSIAWALLVSIAMMTLGLIFTASVVTTVYRSKASTDAVVLTQYADNAVSDAVAKLNAGTPVASTLADSTLKCEKVAVRALCYRYWALPAPGNALDPVRYDLVTRVWIDDGRQREPENGLLVRSTKLPLDVITYQTTAGQGPVLGDGFVAYNATPSGVFANAVFSFANTTLEGANLTVRSYNSQTGVTGTRNATVASANGIAFGNSTQADRTLLYGGSGPAGDHTTRCSGEACAESGTKVAAATYATPTAASVQWMRTVGAAKCTLTFSGDWLASEHSGQLPSGTTCINGSLIVDTPTATTSPLTTLFVNGSVQVRASLNAPLNGQLASPASLLLYSTGAAVSFDTVPGAGVAAMVYAPLASCGTNPANPNKVTYFGALACGTVSIGGNWDQQYDEAAVAEFVDPVPGMAKAFSPGTPTTIGFNEFTAPDGWTASSCVLAPPAGAAGYWKMDELAGVLARDSSGSGLDAGWADATPAARTDGVCNKGALTRPGGAVIGTQTTTATAGLSVEYWAKSLVGTAVQVSGVKVVQDDTRHINVTVGAATVRIPFSVENVDKWHLFAVTVSPAGQVTVYVDGFAKGTAATAVATSSINGPLTIGDNTGAAGGAIDEVVLYNTPLAAAAVADRFTLWNNTVTVTPSPAGTAFSAPGAVGDNLPGGPALGVKWTIPTGNFPTGDPTTSYRLEVAATSSGPWATLGTAVATATTWQQPTPTGGARSYRVCALYNGDVQCSAGVTIATIEAPGAPVVTTGALTPTSAGFSWTAPTYASTYQSQYRVNAGAWSAVANNGTTRTLAVGPVPSGATVEMQARAVNAAGTSAWSTIAAAQLIFPVPAAPVVVAGAVTTTTASFSWSAPAYASSYQSQYRVNSGAWSAIADNGAAQSAAVGPVSIGAKVEMQVRAISTGGTGPWSAITAAQLLSPAPGTPSVNVSSVGYNSVSYSWPGVTYASSYEWQVRYSGGAWSAVTNIGPPPWVTSGSVAQGTLVEAQVRAVGTGGTSAWSAIAGATTIVYVPPQVPTAPSIWVTSAGTTTANFAWSAPANTYSFESQWQVNGGTWFGSSGAGTVIYHGFTQSYTQGPTTQGNQIGMRVRAVGWSGTSGWSSVATAYLQVDYPSASGWSTNSVGPNKYSRVTGVYCPSGTVVQSQYRDQVNQWFGYWNPWQGWVTSNTWGQTADTYSYLGGGGNPNLWINVQTNIRCTNPTTGATSGINGPIGPIRIN